MKTVNHIELERQLKSFAAINFEKPSNCKNLEQIRYYIQELCDKIQEFETRFQHVPSVAYTMLNQYNMAYNSQVVKVFEVVNK